MKNKKTGLALSEQSKSEGFTLIEMLIVIGILAFALPALITIVLGIVRQQFKISALKEVKRQGDLVLNSMKVHIKNYGVSAHDDVPPSSANEICDDVETDSSGSQIYFLDINGGHFGYRLQSNAVNLVDQSSFIQAPGASTALTTNKVRVANLQMSCERTASFSSPIISVSYDVVYNTTSTQPQDNATFTYQTKIKMKN